MGLVGAEVPGELHEAAVDVVLGAGLPDLQLQNIDKPVRKPTVTLRGLVELPATW